MKKIRMIKDRNLTLACLATLYDSIWALHFVKPTACGWTYTLNTKGTRTFYVGIITHYCCGACAWEILIGGTFKGPSLSTYKTEWALLNHPTTNLVRWGRNPMGCTHKAFIVGEASYYMQKSKHM